MNQALTKLKTALTSKQEAVALKIIEDNWLTGEDLAKLPARIVRLLHAAAEVKEVPMEESNDQEENKSSFE